MSDIEWFCEGLAQLKESLDLGAITKKQYEAKLKMLQDEKQEDDFY